MPNSQIWNYLTLTEETILHKEFGIFHSNQPMEFYQESIAFRLHSFCFYYIDKKFPNYYQSNKRKEIETLVWNHYIRQAYLVRIGRPEFQCISSESQIKDRIYINFQLDADSGFQAYKWEIFNNNNLVSSGIDEYKTGNPTTTIYYDTNKLNCILAKTEDTNRNGNPDIWYKFENCKLVSHSEDFNENGNMERSCFYSQDGSLINCDGIGEKNLNLAKQYEDKEDWNQSIYYYTQLIEEYNKEFQGYSRHICLPNYKILQFQYNLMNYIDLNTRYNELKFNPYCEMEVKRSQIYLGFINLYSLNNWITGIEQLVDANKSYKEEYGWDSIEINLALSYGYLHTKDYAACLKTLQKIGGRPFNRKGRYFYFYYYGSCKLGELDLASSIPALKIALESSLEGEEKAIVLYKLGLAYLQIDDPTQQSLSEKYFQNASRINPSLLPAIESVQNKHQELKDFANKP